MADAGRLRPDPCPAQSLPVVLRDAIFRIFQMNHLTAFAASLTSLGLMSAIYYCNILSPQRSWLRSEVLGMILLSLLTGLMPIALVASTLGLWRAFAGGVSMPAAVSAGFDLAGIVAVVATALLFRWRLLWLLFHYPSPCWAASASAAAC